MSAGMQMELGGPGTTVAKREVSLPAGPVDMERIVSLAERGVDPASIREMVALYRDVHAIQAEQAYNEAMHAVQSAMQDVVIPTRGRVVVSKDGTKRPYPLLQDVQKALGPHLVANGLSYAFDTAMLDKAFTLILRVSHVMGVTRETRTTLPLDTSGSKNATQGVGSTESYGMRYGLIKAFGLVRYLHDDDGAGGGGDVGDVEKVSEEQLANLQAVWDEVKGNVDVKAFNAVYGVERLADLPAEKYAQALQQLQRKRR